MKASDWFKVTASMMCRTPNLFLFLHLFFVRQYLICQQINTHPPVQWNEKLRWSVVSVSARCALLSCDTLRGQSYCYAVFIVTKNMLLIFQCRCSYILKFLASILFCLTFSLLRISVCSFLSRYVRIFCAYLVFSFKM